MYAKSKETTQAILEAARSLFVEKHFADVTINDIVNQVNISKGALYHHFDSKEDLYVTMMHYYLAEIQESTQSVTRNCTGSCRERLYESTLNFLQLPEALLGVLRLVRRDINIFELPIREELIRAYQNAIPVQVEAIIRDGIKSDELQAIDSRLLSWELVALVEVALHPYSRALISTPEEMANFVINLFFDGVAAKKT